MTSTGWERVALGDFCQKIGSGATPRGGDSVYVEAGTALIRSQNVYNGELAYEGLAFLGDSEAEALRGVTVQSGDVLLNITGDSVARCCTAPEDVLPARVNQHVAIIRPLPDELIARFLAYYLISPFMQETMLSMAGGGGTRKALTKDMIERFAVPKPPLDHQERIVALLGGYDDLIDNNRRRIKLLENSVRLLFDEWFRRFRFPGHNATAVVEGLPAGWLRSTLGAKVVNQSRRRIPLSSFEREARPGPYPYHGAAGVLDYLDRYIFEGRYLLVGEDGTVQTPAGTPMLQLVEGKFWVSNHAHVLQGGTLSTEFLYCFLGAYPIAGHVTGVAQPKLTQGNLNRIPVLVPPADLRSAFQEIADPVFEQIFVLRAQVDKLRTARDLLLPRLMSGELTV